MKNFIILFSGQEGSSAIISQLKQLKDKIQILGFEPFDLHHLKNNLSGKDLHNMFDIIFKADKKDSVDINTLYKNYSDKHIDIIDKNRSVGFKMRMRDMDTIMEIAKKHDVVIFVLIRRDILRWSISKYTPNAQFDYLNKKIRKNHKIIIDIDKYKKIVESCKNIRERKENIIKNFRNNGINTHPIYYEEYCTDKEMFFSKIFKELDISLDGDELKNFCQLKVYFKKVHSNDITKFVINHEEVKETYKKMCD